MKLQFKAAAVCAVLILCHFSMRGQGLSFEDGFVPAGFSVSEGRLSLSAEKFKHGSNALRVDWKAGSVLTVSQPQGIAEASKIRNGGMNLWIYNSVPSDSDIIFSFCDKSGNEVCRLPFHIAFSGWRCIWAKFQNDMGKDKSAEVADLMVIFPDKGEGCVWLDLLEFTPTVNWQAMSDAQYHVNRTDFSLVMDFNRYRNAVPDTSDVIRAAEDEIAGISDRLTEWYLGAVSDDFADNDFVSERKKAERKFISDGLQRAENVTVRYAQDGSPAGAPLFPMGAPDKINGTGVAKFRTYNEHVLLPLALDFRKNGNAASLEKAQFILDWFHDQGWADGSAMGTLTFEKLRSAGYFHAFHLLKDYLSPERREREKAAMYWYTIFGMCHDFPEYKGEVADNLRALAVPKLACALACDGLSERQVAMTAYKRYMDNALGLAPGYYGTFKADFSGYHHRGPYHSAYYPHALYAGALVAYLLRDTPYALEPETVGNIKNGLLAFRFFCAGADVPAGTVGRFPKGTQILQEMVPAYAYAALCYDEPDKELAAACKAILADAECSKAFGKYVSDVNSTLAYTSSVGEMEAVARLMDRNVEPETVPEGSVFMPYSGVLVAKDKDFQFNAKGYSRYIWDFESSATENLYGRYLAYGHLEYIDFRNGRRSFMPEKENFDWNLISGTTSICLPKQLLEGKGGAFAGHRNFSDMSFLAGVDGAEKASMFAVKLHDINYNPTFRADKSMFFFDDFIVCLGSGISDNDKEHGTVTALFQAFDGAGNVVKKDRIVSDGSLLYAVKDGRLDYSASADGYSRAYIDHGAAPDNAGYEYYIVKHGGKATAQKLLGRKSPVKVLRRDGAAHIVKYEGTVCAALFDASSGYDGMLVRETNIPLAYILETDRDGYSLAVCEPDMRRAYRKHMGELTDEDVVDEEKPFRTSLTLDGLFEVVSTTDGCKDSGATVKIADEDLVVRYADGKTIITFTTVRAENHTFALRRK